MQTSSASNGSIEAAASHCAKRSTVALPSLIIVAVLQGA